MIRWLTAALAALLLLSCGTPETLQVGSKRFTESYVLAEVAKKMLASEGYRVGHKQGLGGTVIVWEALKSGEIHVYPEYTGTIFEAILKQPRVSLDSLRRQLAPLGIGVTGELGFNNTYAFVMPREKAARLGIRRISDLRDHPDLRLGFSHEFMNRGDGWQPLTRHYDLSMSNVVSIEHALAYVAIGNGELDVMDAYATDAKLQTYDLTVLVDDRRFFPAYNAVYLYRLEHAALMRRTVGSLAGRIDSRQMIALNALAESSRDYQKAAGAFLGESGSDAAGESAAVKIGRWTLQHLRLVVISLMLAILAGLPLGITASRPGLFSQLILGATGVVQTIPSLALLALFAAIPFLGIGQLSAVVALFLYSLLPIVRNTATGLQNIPRGIRESAAALGLEPVSRLRKVYLPIASRTILAGIKTSAIINVGTATLAALIGAGGLGEPIISGLSLNDSQTILQGAIPAALLAIAVQLLFDLLDRVLIPRGLRISTSEK